MSSRSVINVKGLQKQYRIYNRPLDRIRELYSVTGRKFHRNYQALSDIDFEVLKGETVGIIGPNGSGKSTLLEIICGTLTQTAGEVTVNGRIAALLELGAGFNPIFSGRENVYLNAALIGITKDEIDERFSDILEFANIGEFIEHPVSTYSSGMYVRLAFATAINTDPDILIVDEALAVGDIRFQRKCFRRFQEMQKEGKTILFVTHAVDLVQSHCSRALYLQHGKVKKIGLPKDVIQTYLEDLFGDNNDHDDISSISESSENQTKQIETRSNSMRAHLENDSLHIKETHCQVVSPEDLCANRNCYNLNEYRWGDRRAVIYDYQLNSDNGKIKSSFNRGEYLTLTARIFFYKNVSNVILGFTIKTVDGRTVFGANTRERKQRLPEYQTGDKIEVTYKFQCLLIPGDYFISLGIAEDDNSKDNVAIDRRYDMIHLPILGEPGDFGVADLGLTITATKE